MSLTKEESLYKRLRDAVAEANYAGAPANAPISNPIAHRVLYAAWRYIQYMDKQKKKEMMK